MYDLTIFGRNLKRWRQFRGLTQEDLATKVGLSKYTISNIEIAKQKNIGLKHIISICEILNVAIEELFVKDPKFKYSKVASASATTKEIKK